MILYKQASTITKKIKQIKQNGHTIGFVPTMGALHKGHISLIEKSKALCDLTISSIFVNPTQFNDLSDFEKYPITIANDILLLEAAGCDVLFLPAFEEIYPHGTGDLPRYELGEIEFLLEGKFRPGHFQGVSQVVHRLLEVIQPDKVIMGQKDYQQCIVVKQLVQLTHLGVEVVTVQTFREESGLAMSSRNLRLLPQEKVIAAGISKMLYYIQEKYLTMPLPELEKYGAEFLLSSGFNKVDYVSIVDGDTLQPVTEVKSSQKLVVLIAAFVGEVRLIDNLVLQLSTFY